ncbi:MAG: hypothetical protein ACI9CD_000858 [Candidatus Deianiraeaceae bacterium]|jgi:hypothetical protein
MEEYKDLKKDTLNQLTFHGLDTQKSLINRSFIYNASTVTVNLVILNKIVDSPPYSLFIFSPLAPIFLCVVSSIFLILGYKKTLQAIEVAHEAILNSTQENKYSKINDTAKTIETLGFGISIISIALTFAVLLCGTCILYSTQTTKSIFELMLNI